MANKPYDNFVLANYIEDQYNSHLDLEKFCTIDKTLEVNNGMKKIVHVYSATNGTEKVAVGVGNTKTIEATYTSKEYDILCAQNRFSYFDEDEMKDPEVVFTGVKHQGVDLYNETNTDIYAEFAKATLEVETTAFNFDAFVDAVALLNKEDYDDTTEVFAFINNKDLAEVKKNVKDDLKYIEAFARTGYVGTVAGVNLYRKKDATDGTIIVGTRQAVTKFSKKGVSIEDERDANTRQNTKYTRKYYVVALTDERYAVKITKKSS